MSESERIVELQRTGPEAFIARNSRGHTIQVGAGENGFTPIELLLVALGGCSGLDLDAILAKRSEFASFHIESRADKVRDSGGNHLTNLQVTFDAQFPDGDEGDAAREFLPKAMAKSHDWLCTVSRTIQLGAPVEYRTR
jgi:putative redox protein